MSQASDLSLLSHFLCNFCSCTTWIVIKFVIHIDVSIEAPRIAKMLFSVFNLLFGGFSPLFFLNWTPAVVHYIFKV